MWRRNESAVTVKWSSSPRRSQAAARISRRRTSCWVSVGVNAVKSCAPTSSAADAWSAASSRGRGHHSARRATERRARTAVRARRSDTTGRWREKRAWKPSTASSAPTTPTSSGSAAFSASASRSVGGPPVRVEAHNLPGRVHAGVGAPGNGEAAPPGQDRVERVAQGALDGPRARLARPALEAGAVVLERQPQGHARGSTSRTSPSTPVTTTSSPGRELVLRSRLPDLAVDLHLPARRQRADDDGGPSDERLGADGRPTPLRPADEEPRLRRRRPVPPR